MRKIYISTAIPYVNADPHIGFALELTQADIYARYRRLVGDTVFFQTGADENSLKNVLSAEHAKKDTQSFIDEKTGNFLKLCSALGLSQDLFWRTTDVKHKEAAQKLWRACADAGYIYKKSYSGRYCVGCEQFYEEDELQDGKCPEHEVAPEMVSEENYFFKLSSFQDELKQKIENNEFEILPPHRKNEVLGVFKEGLRDFSISRSSARAHGWGIPVPGDESQIMYVWFDALTNYIAGCGYGSDDEKFLNFWVGSDEIIHLIGKDISRFHCLYWPAMLLASGVRLPDKVVIHDFLIINSKKMSKSIGNVIDPNIWAKKFTASGLRYFLASLKTFEDSDISEKLAEERYTAELVNGFGNSFSRLANLCSGLDKSIWEKITVEVEVVDGLVDYQKALDGFEFSSALETPRALLSKIDKFLEENQPWTIKDDDIKKATVLLTALQWFVLASALLEPFMPAAVKAVADNFGLKEFKVLTGESISLDNLRKFAGTAQKPAPLFPRLVPIVVS